MTTHWDIYAVAYLGGSHKNMYNVTYMVGHKKEDICAVNYLDDSTSDDAEAVTY